MGKVIFLFLVFLLAGCKSVQYCEIAQPIIMTVDDLNSIDKETLRKIIIHNKSYDRICNG